MLEKKLVYLCAYTVDTDLKDHKLLCSECRSEYFDTKRFDVCTRQNDSSVCTECGYTYLVLSKEPDLENMNFNKYSELRFINAGGEVIFGILYSNNFNTNILEYRKWLQKLFDYFWLCPLTELTTLAFNYREYDDYENCRTQIQDLLADMSKNILLERIKKYDTVSK
jgi:ribosomal protein L33